MQRGAAGPAGAVGPVVVQRRPEPRPGPEPEPPRTSGARPAGGSTTVGLFGAPAAPALGGPTGPGLPGSPGRGPSGGPADGPGGGQDASAAPLPDPSVLLESLERRHLDDLARRLAEPLGRMFRSELRLGRERGGRWLDGGR
ncbi:hypothetical protein ACFVH7_12905 [Kitasatospora indigofera]|uniref:hypothetical protein n=1 Tax=Kitasatospora indigofera TaxID=67307 RepID=UPI003639E21D